MDRTTYTAYNEADIHRIVEEYSPMLLRLACTRLRSTADAEDAVQDAYVKLLTLRPCFRDAEHEKAWLIRTTLHRASDIRRSAEQRNVSLELAAETAAPSRELDEQSQVILSAVQSLPEPYSAVIHLYYYEGYSIREIAGLLKLPVPTVGTRLARGRLRLKQMLKEAFA